METPKPNRREFTKCGLAGLGAMALPAACVTTPAAAPQAQRPSMKRIRNVEIDLGSRHWDSHGDIWPMTWADDDAIYTSGNDTLGCPPGLYGSDPADMRYGRNLLIAKIWGNPPGHRVLTVNPMEQFLWRARHHRVNGKKIGAWKSCGLIFLDGCLYLAVYHSIYHTELKRFPWWTAYMSCIVVSKNYGESWTRWEDSRYFPDRFGSPSFVQFGKSGEHCPDGFVYAVSAAEQRWANDDSYILGRVPRTQILDPGAWTYYSGLGGQEPQWSAEVDRAVTILESRRGLSSTPEVIYHPGLGSYLLATFSVPRLPEDSTDYNDAMMTLGYTTWHLFQAEHLWGPWQRVYEGSGTGPADYCPRLPCKWLGGDNRSAVIVGAGNVFDRFGAGEHYGVVTARMRWEIA
jgi:hypothetical protein